MKITCMRSFSLFILLVVSAYALPLIDMSVPFDFAGSLTPPQVPPDPASIDAPDSLGSLDDTPYHDSINASGEPYQRIFDLYVEEHGHTPPDLQSLFYDVR